MVKRWIISSCLILCCMICFVFGPVFADDLSEMETVPETTEDQSEETESTVPAPTVAPFDFALLENSSVQAVQRLDQVLQILSGMLFFLGVSSGILFAKVLFDRIRTV